MENEKKVIQDLPQTTSEYESPLRISGSHYWRDYLLNSNLDDNLTTYDDSYAHPELSPHFRGKEPHSSPSHLEEYRNVIDAFHNVPEDCDLFVLIVGSAFDESGRNIHLKQQLPAFVIKAALSGIKSAVINVDIAPFDTTLDSLLQFRQIPIEKHQIIKNNLQIQWIHGRFPLKPLEEGPCNVEAAQITIRTIESFITKRMDRDIIIMNSVTLALYPAFLMIICIQHPRLFYISQAYDCPAIIAKPKIYPQDVPFVDPDVENASNISPLVDLEFSLKRIELEEITLEILHSDWSKIEKIQ